MLGRPNASQSQPQNPKQILKCVMYVFFGRVTAWTGGAGEGG